jgi:hypothetical protein
MSKWKAALHKSCITYLKGVRGILEDTLITAVNTQERSFLQQYNKKRKSLDFELGNMPPSQRGERFLKTR